MATFPVVISVVDIASLYDVAMKPIRESERISLTECKRILKKTANGLTDSEVLAIRNWLYFIAELSLSITETKSEILKP